MLTDYEVDHLLICLKAYRPCKETRINRAHHKRICDSCIYKIERFDGYTDFSDQEIQMMIYAIDHASVSLSTFGEIVPAVYDKILEKLRSLSRSAE